jgi:PKHD-type hydroxylase
MDNVPNDNVPRKLSMVLQLSHPSEYEGGDLELMTGNVPHICKKEKGLLYAFPSYILHRVTPITNGTRRTLVVWTSGPRFK